MSALDGLIAAVEGGSCPRENILSAKLWHEVGNVLGAFNGSLDAARALHDALLPGWWWSIGTCKVSDDARVSPEGDAGVLPDGREYCTVTDVDQRPPGNPARAWLLSILIALKAKGGAA